MTVRIQHSAEISEIIGRYGCLEFLKNSAIPRGKSNRWYMSNSRFGYDDQEVYTLQVMFIGKTGYGKSTTLNKIVGKRVFESDEVNACTKNLFQAAYRIEPYRKTFLSLCDLPGIGESNLADAKYLRWYREMLAKSHCAVYVLRADQRDFSIDEKVFRDVFARRESRRKVILALNFADKIEPINRRYGLSREQFSNLRKKISEVSAIFNIPKSCIVYYSAADGSGIDILLSAIARKIKMVIGG